MTVPGPPEPSAASFDQPAFRPTLFAAIAASVGVLVGSFSPWLSILVLTVNGLDFVNWGTATLILAHCPVSLC